MSTAHKIVIACVVALAAAPFLSDLVPAKYSGIVVAVLAVIGALKVEAMKADAPPEAK